MLINWISSGRLTDTFDEFLVKESGSITKKQLDLDFTDEYWDRRYTVSLVEIPSTRSRCSPLLFGYVRSSATEAPSPPPSVAKLLRAPAFPPLARAPSRTSDRGSQAGRAYRDFSSSGSTRSCSRASTSTSSGSAECRPQGPGRVGSRTVGWASGGRRGWWICRTRSEY